MIEFENSAYLRATDLPVNVLTENDKEAFGMSDRLFDVLKNA